MVIYGVHRNVWSSVGEMELLTAHLGNADDYAKHQSDNWPYGLVIVTSRELDTPGALRVISVWQNGEKIKDHGPHGEWRKVKHSPI